MSFITSKTGLISIFNSKLDLNAPQIDSGAFYCHITYIDDDTYQLTNDTNNLSSVDNYYKNMVLEIIDGTAIGQFAQIIDYNSSDHTITIIFPIKPDSTSLCWIHPVSGRIASSRYQQITISSASSVQLINNIYNGCIFLILDGSSKGILFKIEECTVTDNTMIIKHNENYLDFPDSTSLFCIVCESGIGTIIDSNRFQLQPYHRHIVPKMIIDFNNGTAADILSVDVTTAIVTIIPNFNLSSDAIGTSYNYIVYNGFVGKYEDITPYSSVSTLTALKSHSLAVLSISHAFTGDGLNSQETLTLIGKNYSNTHSYSPNAPFYKIKLINIYPDMQGSVNTIYHVSKSDINTGNVSGIINATQDAQITRSILTGKTLSGNYIPLRSDINGNLLTNIAEPIDFFGSITTNRLNPMYQVHFVYGIPDELTVCSFSKCLKIRTVQMGDVNVSHQEHICLPDATALKHANYFTVFPENSPANIIFNITGEPIDKNPNDIMVNINATDNSSIVAQKVVDAINLKNTSINASTVMFNKILLSHTTTGIRHSTQNGDIAVNSAGIITTRDSLLSLSNQAGINDYALLRTKHVLKYRPGQSAISAFTCIFDIPANNTQQLAGVMNSHGCFAFGYNGLNFGIYHRNRGYHHSCYLKILMTGNPQAGQKCKYLITLDDLQFIKEIVIPEAPTAAKIAWLLSKNTYHNAQFITRQCDDKVYFISEYAGHRVGKYSFSSMDSTCSIYLTGGSISGTFETVIIGKASTETWHGQNEWNVDRMDGYGLSGEILNPLMGNVYKIEYQWLGFGQITFRIETKYDGRLNNVHKIRYCNSHVDTSQINPSMYQFYQVCSKDAAKQLTIKAGSASGFVYGDDHHHYIHRCFGKNINVNTSEPVYVMTLAMNYVFKGLSSEIEAKLTSLSCVCANGTLLLKIFKNSDVTNGTNYQQISTESAIIVDTGATRFSGGTLIMEKIITNSSNNIDISNMGIIITPYDTLTFVLCRIGSGKISCYVSCAWNENQ